MKANEIEDGKVLMIGDLVVGCIETDIVDEATYKILCKVTDINHYGDASCEALKPFPDELDWQDGDDFSWIEPIPLTAEILEKNFKSKRNIFGLQTYILDENFSLEDRGSKLCLVRTCNDYIGSKFWVCDIMYVHQLQHALKLFNIEQEIEL